MTDLRRFQSPMFLHSPQKRNVNGKHQYKMINLWTMPFLCALVHNRNLSVSQTTGTKNRLWIFCPKPFVISKLTRAPLLFFARVEINKSVCVCVCVCVERKKKIQLNIETINSHQMFWKLLLAGAKFSSFLPLMNFSWKFIFCGCLINFFCKA